MEDERFNPQFCTPQDEVTSSCSEYMLRIADLRGFVNFFFNLVKSAGAMTRILSLRDGGKSLPPDLSLATNPPLVGYRYSDHRQLVNEIMLTRAVESFDLYIVLILKELFCSRPEMLKSESSVEMSVLIGLKSFENIVTFVAERKVHELSYKPLSELRHYINSRTKLDLFKDKASYEAVLIASEIRNLIAHNDCRVNSTFRQKTNGINLRGLEAHDGERIQLTDEQLRHWSYHLDAVVFEFDKSVLGKYQLGKTLWRDKLITK